MATTSGREPATQPPKPSILGLIFGTLLIVLVAVLIGLVALAGYVYGTRVLYGVGASIPMAVNTALGRSVPDEQALPAETAMPAMSKRMSCACAFTPGMR